MRLGDWIAALALVVAVGSLAVSFIAERDSAKQTEIAAKNAALERNTPLVLRCPSGTDHVDATWEFNDTSDSFTDGVLGQPKGQWTCSLTNFGRVPVLLVQPHFLFIRTTNGLCDFATGKYAGLRGDQILRAATRVDLPIPAIAAGATYTIAVQDNLAKTWAFVYVPASARYEVLGDANPVDRKLLGRGVKGFVDSESFTLEPHSLEVRKGANACFKDYRRQNNG